MHPELARFVKKKKSESDLAAQGYRTCPVAAQELKTCALAVLSAAPTDFSEFPNDILSSPTELLRSTL